MYEANGATHHHGSGTNSISLMNLHCTENATELSILIGRAFDPLKTARRVVQAGG